MNNEIDYKVITGDDELKFKEEVIKHLREGYQLTGGVSLFHINSSLFRVQAVYKKLITKKI